LALSLAACGGSDPGASSTRLAVATYTIETFAGNGTQGQPPLLARATAAPLYQPASVAVDHYGTVYIGDLTGVRLVFDGFMSTLSPTHLIGEIHDVASSGIRDDLEPEPIRFGPVVFVSGSEAMLWYIGTENGPWAGDLVYPSKLVGFVAPDFDVTVRVANGAAGQIVKASDLDSLPDFLIAGRPGRTGANAERCDLNEEGGSPFACVRYAGRMFMKFSPDLLDFDYHFCDTANHRVRRITRKGVITTVAGGAGTDLTDDVTRGFSGDGGPAALARLDSPTGVAGDDDGNIYVADSGNLRVRVVDRNGLITTIAGTGVPGSEGDGGPALEASFCGLAGIAVDREGNVYVTDTCNFKIRVLRPEPRQEP
jgi:hypothetical protein